MIAMKRFLLALTGRRAPHVQDDDDRPWPWWNEDNEDHESLNFIRAEQRQRAHDDLMEVLDKKPQKKLTIITTGDIGGPKKEGQK
jgi:hypothetical protein